MHDEAPIPRRPETLVELPLSALQQRMWFLCTAYPGTSSSMVCLVHRLRGDLVVDAWERAVSAVVDRHEGLRTTFADRPGGTVQVIGPAQGIETEHIDLSHLPVAAREDRARDLLLARKQVLLDLERGPLVSSALLRLDRDDHIWCMTIHHILADGASETILVGEVCALYRAYVEGVEPALVDPPLGYGDFAVWQAGRAAEDEEDLRWWVRRLSDVPVLDLPTDHPRPAEKGTRAAEVRRLLDGDLVTRLDKLARAERCTLFMLLLAVYQMLLAQRSGQRDICVGTPIVGRTRAELEPVVGLLANVLPLRGDLSGEQTFRELLSRTRDVVLDALDRQEIPFGRVVTELALPHNLAQTQVFQAFFVLHEFEVKGGTELPGVVVEEFPMGGPMVIHDLVLDAWRTDDGLWCLFRYDSALFTPATVTAMAERFAELLHAIVDSPDVRVPALIA